MANAEVKRKPSQLKNIISGGVGGIYLVLAGHPMDTIKVNMQTSSDKSMSFAKCLTDIFRNQGIKGYYKGMSAPLVGVTPIISISFWSYGLGKTVQMNPNDRMENLSLFKIFNAGCFSGLATAFIIIPGDRIKCLLQTQSIENPRFKGAKDCIKFIASEGGIKSFYRGAFPTLVRDVPGSGLYFLFYEYAMRLWRDDSRSSNNPLKSFVIGGVTGIVFWLYAIVPDTLKTRMQIAPAGRYKGMLDVLFTTIRTEGFITLFNGLTAVMIRSFPSNGACFLGFESTMNFLEKYAPYL